MSLIGYDYRWCTSGLNNGKYGHNGTWYIIWLLYNHRKTKHLMLKSLFHSSFHKGTSPHNINNEKKNSPKQKQKIHMYYVSSIQIQPYQNKIICYVSAVLF